MNQNNNFNDKLSLVILLFRFPSARCVNNICTCPEYKGNPAEGEDCPTDKAYLCSTCINGKTGPKCDTSLHVVPANQTLTESEVDF